MGKEIERKFLVKGDGWKDNAAKDPKHIEQAYLSIDPLHTIRVRIINQYSAFLTIKGKSKGAVRLEFEYNIPLEDAEYIMGMTQIALTKLRYKVVENGLNWEVDVFPGGLVLAEIEFPTEDTHIKELPEWLGREVTNDSDYQNSNLAKLFSTMSPKEVN